MSTIHKYQPLNSLILLHDISINLIYIAKSFHIPKQLSTNILSKYEKELKELATHKHGIRFLFKNNLMLSILRYKPDSITIDELNDGLNSADYTFLALEDPNMLPKDYLESVGLDKKIKTKYNFILYDFIDSVLQNIDIKQRESSDDMSLHHDLILDKFFKKIIESKE